MTPPELVQIILAIATLVGAFAALASSLRNGAKQKQTHDLVNGQSHELAKLQEARSYSRGRKSGARAVKSPQGPVSAPTDAP